MISYVSLFLTYFTLYDNLISSMLLPMVLFHSFLWCGSTSFSIHLLLDSLLGGFPVLAIVHSAAVNIVVRVSF